MRVQINIGGQWIEVQSGELFTRIHTANEEIIAATAIYGSWQLIAQVRCERRGVLH